MECDGRGLAVAGHPGLGLGVAGATVADLARKLGSVEDAPALAARRVGLVRAGELLAPAVSDRGGPSPPAALPCAGCAGPCSPRTWCRPSMGRANDRGGSRRPPRPRPTYLGLRLPDDIAYGSGVWVGVVRARTPRVVFPRLVFPAERARDLVGDATALMPYVGFSRRRRSGEQLDQHQHRDDHDAASSTRSEPGVSFVVTRRIRMPTPTAGQSRIGRGSDP